MKQERGFLLIFLILLAGCTLHPRYERPAVDVPTEWKDEGAVKSDGTVSVEWWRRLNDPVLNELIQMAVDNNQDIQVAIHRVDEFAAQLGIVRSQLYPQISGTASAQREKISTNLSPLTPGAPATFDAYELLINLSYELDIWGKIRSATQAALADLLAQIEVRKTVVLTVVGQVAASYAQLRQYDSQLLIAHETLASRQEAYDLAAVRFGIGLTSEMPVKQAQAEVENAAAEVKRLEISVSTQENLISVLLGVPSMKIKRGLSINDLVKPTEIPATLPSKLLTQRPDILQAEQQLIAANARIGVARARFFPEFDFMASGGYESIHLNNLFTSPSKVWDYGLTLLQEIFTGGRLTNELKRTQAAKLTQLHQYQSVILTAFQEVNDALVTYRKTKELMEVEKAKVKTVADYLHLATLQYNNGQTDYLTVLDAERQLFSAQLDYAQAQGEHLVAYADVYRAFAGTWVNVADESAMHAEQVRNK